MKLKGAIEEGELEEERADHGSQDQVKYRRRQGGEIALETGSDHLNGRLPKQNGLSPDGAPDEGIGKGMQRYLSWVD